MRPHSRYAFWACAVFLFVLIPTSPARAIGLCASQCSASSPCSTPCYDEEFPGGPQLLSTCGDWGLCLSCGNGLCESGESCTTCPGDCGGCQPCGDGTCSGSETCSSCAADCGACWGDADADGLDDWCEQRLAETYLPYLRLSWLTPDLYQALASNVWGGNSDLNVFPFRARRYDATKAAGAYTSHHEIEIRYGIAFHNDCGDNPSTTTCSGNFSHVGDSELAAVLLIDDIDGLTPTSADFCKLDRWKMVFSIQSSHLGEVKVDSSTFAYYQGTQQIPPTLYSAEGKHALYLSDALCDAGGFQLPLLGGADECYNHYSLRDPSRLKNVGEPPTPLDSLIHEPCPPSNIFCTGSYDIWGGEDYGTASPYAGRFAGEIDWYRHTECAWATDGSLPATPAGYPIYLCARFLPGMAPDTVDQMIHDDGDSCTDLCIARPRTESCWVNYSCPGGCQVWVSGSRTVTCSPQCQKTTGACSYDLGVAQELCAIECPAGGCSTKCVALKSCTQDCECGQGTCSNGRCLCDFF